VFGDVRVAVAAIRHDGGARSTTRTGRKTENMTAAPSSDPTEIDQMREELDTLRGQLDAERRQRSARTRRAFTWVLTALAVLATVLSLLSVWTLRTLTNTDLFVDRVGSVIEQPAVAQEIGEQAAAQLVEALGLQQRIAEVLPPEAAIAAGPITIAARDFLAEGTTDLVQTEQFRQAWDTAGRLAPARHRHPVRRGHHLGHERGRRDRAQPHPGGERPDRAGLGVPLRGARPRHRRADADRGHDRGCGGGA
jgi:hypothetical protein